MRRGLRIAAILRVLWILPLTARFLMTAIFPTLAIFLAASVARKNTAGSSEQGGNAY